MLPFHLLRRKLEELKCLGLLVSIFPGLDKVLLSGVLLVLDCNTWYHHLFRTKSKVLGFCLVVSVLNGHGWLFQASSANTQLTVPRVPLTDHGAAHKSWRSWHQLLGNWNRHQEVVFPALLHRLTTQKLYCAGLHTLPNVAERNSHFLTHFDYSFIEIFIFLFILVI